MPAIASGIAGLVICVWVAVANAQTAEPLSAGEKLELQIYREEAPKLQARIAELEQQLTFATACQGTNPDNDEACIYRAKWYEFQGKALDFNLSLFEWQIFAANCILFFIGILTIAGVVFAGYQLWTSAKLATLSGNSVELAVSTRQVRLQTSVVGIVLIVVAGVFLLVFLREVYKIEPVEIFRTHPATNAS